MNCPKCGAQLECIEENRYHCPNCNATFVAKAAPVPQPQQYIAYDNTGYANMSAQEQPAQTKITARYVRRGAAPMVKKNFGFCFLTTLLLTIVQIASWAVMVIGRLLAGGAVDSSYAGFWVDVAEDKCEGINSTFRGFNNLLPAFRLNILILLTWLVPLALIGIIFAVSFLVGHPILLIIGAIVASLLMLFCAIFLNSLSQYAYCALNAGVSRKAREVYGHAFRLVGKNFGKIFRLKLSFIGWWLLCLLTFGILFLYVQPLYKTSLARQYLLITNQI